MIENEFGEFFPPTLDESGNSYNSQFTIRDYFAAKAIIDTTGSPVDRADWAYQVADAMLERRKS